MTRRERPFSFASAKGFFADYSGSEQGDVVSRGPHHGEHTRLGKRVLQYNCKDGSADIVLQSDAEAASDTTKVELPRKMKEVALFIDADTQQQVSTSPNHNNQNNVLLAKIQLDRLPHAKSRHVSRLRYVYVQNLNYLICNEASR